MTDKRKDLIFMKSFQPIPYSNIPSDNSNLGKVYLVGAGPGDIGLLTLRGYQLLQEADLIVYDQLVGASIFSLIPPDTELISVGKYAGNHTMEQDKINQLLFTQAQAGKIVVRLKGGDPFLFGRGGEELELLKAHNIPFEIVPGITSALSVPAYAGIPVTHRDLSPSVHIITAHRKRGSQEEIPFSSLVALGDVTLVFLMGVGKLEPICRGLMEAGKPCDTPAAIIQNGTRSNQKTVCATLETLPFQAKKAQISTPGIIVVGAVCSLSTQFQWIKNRPLFSKRILVTRPQNKPSTFAQKLRRLGAEVLECPLTSIHTLSDFSDFYHHLSDYDLVIFTSTASVDAFFEDLIKTQTDLRTLSHLRFAVVGNGTKQALIRHGIFADFVPSIHTGAALGALLSQTSIKKAALFAPKGFIGDCEAMLKDYNIPHQVFAAYETLPLVPPDISFAEQDILTFTSANAVRAFSDAFLSNHRKILLSLPAICIGPKTKETADSYGYQTIMSKDSTFDSMIETILHL